MCFLPLCSYSKRLGYWAALRKIALHCQFNLMMYKKGRQLWSRAKARICMIVLMQELTHWTKSANTLIYQFFEAVFVSNILWILDNSAVACSQVWESSKIRSLSGNSKKKACAGHEKYMKLLQTFSYWVTWPSFGSECWSRSSQGSQQVQKLPKSYWKATNFGMNFPFTAT